MFKRTKILNSQLKKRFEEIFPKHMAEFKDVKEKYGEKVLGEVKVSQVLGGMRGIPGLFYETSKLDAEKGILLRNHNLFELCEKLKYNNSEEPLPEALLWYLFTGEIPNSTQIKSIMDEVSERSAKFPFQNTEKL